MLSNTCKYAIRAVIYLAQNGGDEKKIGIKKISGDLDIPTPFLGKILQSLAKKKLLTSTKGPHGGFGIGKSVDDISLYDIVEAIDGTDIFTHCLIGLRPCKKSEEDQPACPVHEEYSKIRKQLNNYFHTESIGSIIAKMKDKTDYIKI
jgi:Rrf2 family protein